MKSGYRFYGVVSAINLLDGTVGILVPLVAAASGAHASVVGLLSFFATLPWLLSPFVGTLVDRGGSAAALALSSLLRPAFLGSIAMCMWISGMHAMMVFWWALLALLVGFIDMFSDVSIQTHVGAVTAENKIEKVYGHVATLQTIFGGLIAPALAGYLAGFSLLTVLPIVAASSLLIIPLTKGTASPLAAGGFLKSIRSRQSGSTFLRDSLSGLRLIWRDSWLRRTAWTIGILNVLHSATATVGMVYFVQSLQFSPSLLGLSFSLVGLASALGGLLASRYAQSLQFKRSVILGAVGFIINAAAPLVSVELWPIVTIWIIGALFTPFFAISIISHRQRMYPSNIVGRLNGSFQLIGIGIAPLGGLLGGLLVLIIGLLPVLWISLIVSIGALLLGMPWRKS